MFKKALSLLLAIMIICSLTGCTEVLGGTFFLFLAKAGDDRASQNAIFQFVRKNEDKLENAIETGDFAAFENKGIIKSIEVDAAVVDFSCGGYGMGPSTSYVGFYYTPENDMAAVWCAPSSAGALTPSGNGFEWQEPGGDNRYYTEHICGNFYYYTASF